MTNAPSKDIKALLVTAGLATGDIKLGRLPESGNDKVIAIKDTGGFPPNPAFLIDNPTVQILIRGNKQDYSVTYTLARLIIDALLGLPKQTVNGTVYIGIWMQSDIIPLGYDESQRPMFSLNFRLVREPASGTYRTQG